MVDRILLFKLVDSNARHEVAQQLERDLAHLAHVVLVTVGLPADDASAKSWDVSCVLRFSSRSDLDAALASRVFHDCLEGELKARCAVIKAWSFAQI